MTDQDEQRGVSADLAKLAILALAGVGSIKIRPGRGVDLVAILEKALARELTNEERVTLARATVAMEADLAAPPKTKKRRLQGPAAMGTYEELFRVSAAVADARVGKDWRESGDGSSLIHHRERSAFDVRFVPAVGGDRWASPTPETAEAAGSLFALAEANGGLDTAYLAYVCGDLAVEHEHETVSIDNLGRMIGRDPRSTKGREAMRRDLWERLKFLDGITVWGTRKHTYRDPKTREKVTITSRDALFLISGTDWPEQGSLSGDDVPTGVKFAAGPLLAEWRGVPEVLTSFGDFRRLAAIPQGQPNGNWARAMGTTITQRWRDRASYGGTTKFTRRYLLENLLPDAPTAADVLAGANPLRARAYFTAALKTLRTAHVIGSFTEPDATKLPRYDWADAWLGQTVDIQPRTDVLTASEAIRAHAAGRAAAPTRKRRSKKVEKE